jgi:hypothetical protein
MLSKCANPDCTTTLHYLREGKVFKLEMSAGSPGEGRKPVRRVEHFWLCGECSQKLTLSFDDANMRVMPKPGSAMVRRAAAS